MAEPTLYARMELRLNDFEKKLARATKSTDTTMRKIEARGEQMTARMKGIGAGAFGGLLKGAALTLAPILSVTAALQGARDALDQFSAVADNSKSAGLDPETYQALAYQAEQAGVAFDAFAGGLNTFAKNAGLAAEGKGRMVTALKALNPELLANIQLAQTQEQRLRLAADAINAEGDAARKAALSTALFGDSGFRMAEAFAGGSAAMDAMAAKARALGLVIDRDLIARSEQLGDELSTASQVMDLQFKQALVNLAPILIGTAQLAGNLAAAVNYLTQSMQALQDRSTERLEQDYEGLTATLAQANATYAPGVVGGDVMGVQIDPAKQAEMQAEADAMRAELKRRAIAKLAAELNQPKLESFELPEVTGGGGGGGNSAAQSALAHGDAVKKLIEDLKFEKQIVGETALEQEVLNTLRNAGVDAASAEGQAIRALITDLDAQKSATQAAAQAMEQFQGIAKDALQGFISDLREGKSGAEALNNALSNVAAQVANMALSALGNAIFPGLGNVVGGLFADGGYTGDGGKNQPAGVVHKGEYVFSKEATGRIGVGNLERLHRGYANGGYVGSPGPVVARAANNNAGGALTVHIELDNDLLNARVVNTAGQVVAKAAPTIIKRANDSAALSVAERQARRG